MVKKIIVFGVKTLLFITAVVLGTSCVNEEYGLNKDNLNLEITAFEKGLTLPLGKTDRIEVQDMLAEVESDFLTVGDDGSYSIVYDGSYNVDGMSDLKGMLNIPDVRFSEKLVFNFGNAAVRAAVNLEAPVEKELMFDFITANDMPDEIEALGLVEFEDTYIDISLDASMLPSFNASMLSVELNVVFPDWADIEGADENGALLLKGALMENGRVDFGSLKVNSMDMTGADLENGVQLSLNVDGHVKLSVSSADVQQWIGKNLTLSLGVAINSINISKLSCKLDYSLDPVVETIDMGDLNSFFGDLGSDVNLGFNHVGLYLDVVTNIGVSAIADVKLVPYYEGVADEDRTVSANVMLNVAESSATEAVTNYVFDEEPVLALLENVPEKIELRAGVKSDPSKYSIIEPNAEYSMNVGYGFELPLEFGDDFAMTYRDTIPDMPAILGSLLSMGNKVMLAGEIENTLPLGLDLKLNFLDSEDNVVPAIEGSGVQKISPCGQSGNASKTTVEMLVALMDGVEAEDIVSLELVFRASSEGAAGVQVTVDDYLQAVFQLVLPEGLTVDLNDIIENEEQEEEEYE